jgi:hypothetical protein
MHLEQVLCDTDADDGNLFADALSSISYVDTTSLAHPDAVSGDWHAPHLYLLSLFLDPGDTDFLGPADAAVIGASDAGR